MQFSGNNLLTTTQNVWFLICLFKLSSTSSINNCNNLVSPVYTVYSSSFVGTLENDIAGSALEPCQLKKISSSYQTFSNSAQSKKIILLL